MGRQAFQRQGQERLASNNQGTPVFFHQTRQVQSMQCTVKLKETFHSDTIKQSREGNTVKLYILASLSYPYHCSLPNLYTGSCVFSRSLLVPALGYFRFVYLFVCLFIWVLFCFFFCFFLFCFFKLNRIPSVRRSLCFRFGSFCSVLFARLTDSLLVVHVYFINPFPSPPPPTASSFEQLLGGQVIVYKLKQLILVEQTVRNPWRTQAGFKPVPLWVCASRILSLPGGIVEGVACLLLQPKAFL